MKDATDMSPEELAQAVLELKPVAVERAVNLLQSTYLNKIGFPPGTICRIRHEPVSRQVIPKGSLVVVTDEFPTYWTGRSAIPSEGVMSSSCIVVRCKESLIDVHPTSLKKMHPLELLALQAGEL